MRRLSLALLMVSCLAAAPAMATTMAELSQAELTYMADLVVEAEVEAVQAERADGAIWIKSVVTLRLTRVLKGDAIEGDRVMLREWGGDLNGDVTEVASAPAYSVGERVLVFLEREERAGGMWRTLGMTQGKFTLVQEPDTGRDVLLKNVSRSVPQFVEAAVPLPAMRRYSDSVINAVIEQTDAGFVPAYSRIPGVPQWRDDLFHAAALAAGQSIDPRWAQVRQKLAVAPTGGE